MKLMKKRGQSGVGSIGGFILAIGTATIILVIVLIVLAELKGSTTDGNATEAAGAVMVKLGTIPTWIGIIIVVAMAFIVLGYFYVRGKGMT